MSWVMCWRRQSAAARMRTAVVARPQTRLPHPKTICMRIQRLLSTPPLPPSSIPPCSTIPPITHTFTASSCWPDCTYNWHRTTTGGWTIIYNDNNDIQILRLRQQKIGFPAPHGHSLLCILKTCVYVLIWMDNNGRRSFRCVQCHCFICSHHTHTTAQQETSGLVCNIWNLYVIAQ